ncbi:hypothetical protein ACFWNI_33595 [Streptomyces sp. NPDC058377]|uniref:hypothetical protein n=1 Tax=Streptomyces sp. NPDC058377 TaxID=3346468 RepID=UPI0036689F09
MSEFVRGFRLHLRTGPALDGAAFPSGRAVVLDDPEYGLATIATSLEDLLRGGYHGARIEWADQAPAYQRCAQHPEAPVIGGLCGGCTQYGETIPGTPTIADWSGEQQGPAVSGGDVATEERP